MIDRFFRATALVLSLSAAQVALAKDAPPAAPAPAATPAPTTAPAPAPTPAPAAPAAKQPSAGQTAARDRQKKCGEEWRGLTDAQKASQGPKWPQFWSKCNKRLKGADKV